MDSQIIHQATSQIQKSTPLKNGEDEYAIVISAPKISQSSDEEIKQSLRFAMILVGIKANTIASMEEEEKRILISFLKNQFGWHTIEEIKLAFTKACAGELIVDARPFENFTCEYVGRIMKAYKDWATEQNIRLRSIVNVDKYRKYELISPESDGIELGDIYYQEFIKNDFNFRTATSACWDNLKKTFSIVLAKDKNCEILKAAKSLYIADQDEILNTYSKGLKLSMAQSAKNSASSDNPNVLLENEGILCYCKRLGLLEWFKQLKEKDVQSIYEYKKTFHNEK